jgi:multidrug efflux system outer membrane protein
MNRLLLPALASTALALSACGTLAPAYHRPVAPVPANWPQGEAYPAPSGPEVAQPPAWKTTFTDAKLQGLIDTALTQNRTLRAAVADVAAARAQYDVQRANLLPTVNATAGAVYSKEPLTSTGLPGTTGSTGAAAAATPRAIETHAFTAGLGVTDYELDLFGKQRSLSQAAFEQYLATDEGRSAAQLSLVAEVANAYLTLAADRTLLSLAKETQRSGDETLNLTQHRFENGIASQLDVSQAQTIVQQARADVARYTAAAARDKNALDLAVGAQVDESRTPATIDEASAGLADVPAGLSSQILLSRPDVLQADHSLRSANANIGAARAAFFPSITLTGQAGVASSSLSGLFNNPIGVWSFAPAITLPIFDAGRNSANLRVTKAQKDSAVAQYEAAVQAAFRDVADGLADRAGTMRQLDAEQALVKASADALRLSTARYERGVDPYLTTLDSQRQLYAVQQALIAVQLARAQNTVTLYKALGGQ